MNRYGSILPTVIETIGMQVWLGLAAMGKGLLGLAGMQITLTAEHAILKSVVRRKPGAYLRNLPGSFAVSAIETVIWGVGLFLWKRIHPLVGYLFLVLAINVEHTIQDAFFEDRPLFGRLWDNSLLSGTIVEVTGFTAAQGFVDEFGPIGAVYGAPIFFLANWIEHNLLSRKVQL